MSRLVGIATAGVGGVLLVLLLWALMNHDGAGILHVARRMLVGKALYADVADVNPTPSFLPGLPPAWLADLLSVSPRLGWAGAVLAA